MTKIDELERILLYVFFKPVKKDSKTPAGVLESR